MSQLIIYLGNTSIIELQSLTNSVTDAAITNATVTARIVDNTGASVSGQTWPLTLTHVSAGTYRGTIENDIGISLDKIYTAIIDADVSGVGAARWEVPVTTADRT